MREAHALKAAGRLDEAVRRYGEAVAANPRSGVAEHELAACLGEDGRWAEAGPHIRAAFAKGLDTPETWVMAGRCELAAGRLEEADTAFREALKRRGDMYDAHRELAQLVWMRTSDVRAALAEVELALVRGADSPALLLLKAQVLDFAGDAEQAFAMMLDLLAVMPRQAGLAVQASRLAVGLGRSDEALVLARRAQAEAPHELAVMIALTEALLSTGDAAGAADLAADMRRTWSTNQHAIALQATAWRMLADPRYRLLHDYDRLMGVEMLDTPAGWSSLQAYVADVAKALDQLHVFASHPFGYAVRGGSLVTHVLRQAHPALRALPRALDGAIRRRLAKMGDGDDPARARNRGTYQLQGMWSAKLKPGGRVVDQAPPQGWLSAVCYLETGAATGREGGLRFGQPGVRTHPMLRAEHVVEPKPGMVALFPSYMWHGSGPLSGDKPQLLLGFDLAPGRVELPDDGV